MAKKITTTSRLEAARATLAADIKQIGELGVLRDAALIADNDDDAAQLLIEIDALRIRTRNLADKVALLEAEAKKEFDAAALRRQAQLIGRFAKKLADADAIAVELQDEILPQFLKKTRKIIELREKARFAFAVHSSHAQAAAGAPEGAAMSAQAVMVLLSNELYRISCDPFLGGVPGAQHKPSLPGARPPSLQVQLTPDAITPFAEKLKLASAFAVETLKAEICAPGESNSIHGPIGPSNGGPIAPPQDHSGDVITSSSPPPHNGAVATPTPPPPTNGGTNVEPQRTPAQARLGGLLKRMDELAASDDAAAQHEYKTLIREIARVQLEVDTQNLGAPHG